MKFVNTLIKTKDDYSVVEKWYLDYRKYPAIAFEFLPKLTSLTYLNGKSICSASLYETNTPICYIENVIADPNSEKEIRDLALDSSIRYIMDLAKDKGFKLWSAHSKLNVIQERSKNFKRAFAEFGHYWMTGDL